MEVLPGGLRVSQAKQRDRLRIRPMGMVMGLEEDWPAEGCHSSCVGRTERVPFSFLYEASTEGVEAVMAALL